MSDIKVNITLDFMQRDTVLAILKEMTEIKSKLSDIAVSEIEKSYCKKHAEIAKELYDVIYEQKIEEIKKKIK